MSIGPGTSSTEAYVARPSTSASFGLIGITLKPCSLNARRALLPNFARLLEAPTTATVFMERLSLAVAISPWAVLTGWIHEHESSVRRSRRLAPRSGAKRHCKANEACTLHVPSRGLVRGRL